MWVLVTFGGGSFRWRHAALRLTRQVRRANGVRAVAVTDKTIAELGIPRSEEVVNAAARFAKGQGYWIWKPAIVAALLSETSVEGVIYADSGCEFNASRDSQRTLDRWIQETLRTGSRFWEVEGHWTDRMYCNARTRQRLAQNDACLDSRQVQATCFMLARTPENMRLVEEWLSICLEDDLGYASDRYTAEEIEDPAFVEHRHDQAILSGLVKNSGIKVWPNETHFAPDWRVSGAAFPIWSLRNRGFSSFINHGFSNRLERAARSTARAIRSRARRFARTGSAALLEHTEQ